MKLIMCLFFLLFSTIAAQDHLPEFSFDYARIELNKNYIRIAWLTTPNCDGEVTYAVKLVFNNINITYDVSDTFLDISRVTLGNDTLFQYKILVEAYCNMSIYMLSDATLTIPHAVSTNIIEIPPKQSRCFQPQSLTLSVIWPKSEDSTDGSCICNQWYHLSSCQCSSNSIRAFNNVSISPDNSQICWSNIHNMTKIFFVHERPNPTDQSNPLVVPPVNREFDLSYVILIIPENPSPPRIEFRDNIISIINTYNDRLSPVTSYDVEISDATSNTLTLHSERGTLESITYINLYAISKYSLDNCGPFNIKVRGNNVIGKSDWRIYLSTAPVNDKCQCLKNNVIFEVEYLTMLSTLIEGRLACSSPYNTTDNIQLSTTSMDFPQTLSVRCSNLFEINNLSPATNYEFNLEWNDGMDIKCTVNTNLYKFSTLSKATFYKYPFYHVIIMLFLFHSILF